MFWAPSLTKKMNNSVELALQKLQTTAWRTSSARYNAARRLRRREIVSTASLAFFSALSVAIAFAEKVVAQGAPALDAYLSLLSATLGVFLLAISLIEWGARNGAKAEILHNSAEDLNALQRKIEEQIDRSRGGINVGWEQYSALRKEYEDTKRRCLENHQPIDDAAFVAKHRCSPELVVSGKPRVDKVRAISTWLFYQASSVWHYAVLWVFIIVAVAVAPWP